jgi:hypothetical protein
MVMIGTDSHKRTHTAVALDEVGRRLAEKMVPATSDGHLALVSWARQWPQVSFAGRGLPEHDPSARARSARGRASTGAGPDPADGTGPRVGTPAGQI